VAYGPTHDKLKPNSPLHELIKKNIDSRWTASASKIQNQHEKWRKSEDQFLAFLPERDVDAKRRLEREIEGKPQYTTIVLPYSYAMLMAAHSYWTTVFLSRSPVFQYSGRHGETEQQVQAVEALIAYQMQVPPENLVSLYMWLLDPGKFGVGVLGCYWDEEFTMASEYVETPETFLGLWETGKTNRELVTRRIPGYRGNKFYNVRPYDWYPDPRVSMWEHQKGEFEGVYREVGWNYLMRGAQSGQYTNIDILRAKKAQGQYGAVSREQGSPQVELPNDSLYTVSQWDLQETGPYGILEMYVDLVPREWNLGPSIYNEKWCFTCTVTGGTTGVRFGRGNIDLVIGARPLGSFHGKFPFHVLEMEPEAYAFTSRSMLEIVKPLQNAMDWLFNAHMYNVRKVLNDQIIVDPSRVVMGDLLDPMPGGVIRLKPAAYGSDIKSIISQLNVVDITRSHINDMQVVNEFGQRAIGVTDQIMGMFQQGGRRSASEARISSTFGINRQKTNAEFMSALGFSPLAQMLVQHSQQYYDAEMQFKIAGDLMLDAGNGLINVDPSAIAGSYDFVPVDGTLPIDRYAQANLWRELLVGMRQMPEIAMQFDMGRIFSWVAQIAGLKNILRFKLAPDQLLAKQAQMGNVIPMPGRQPTRSNAGATSPEPGQIAGMGATG
jgi:hypothetical protein